MDDMTYADPAVADVINREFIPIRVDIDKRPDISERYNRGGFPTTAFLSDKGESIWGATFIPPSDMSRIMKALLDAKASGEIDQALERNRLQAIDLAKSWKMPLPDSEIVEALFEDVLSAYDVEHGGFGTAPKFPHPDVVELLIDKHELDGDEEALDAAIRTIDGMGAGLYDEAEGGVFRYSVTRDWKEPHYEKMLETNIGYLRNLVHAHTVTGVPEHARRAKGVAKYVIDVLQEKSAGGFYGSQDADEEYYKMPPEMRSRRPAPSIDRTVYSGWNSEAVSSLIRAGTLLGERGWISSAKRAWEYSVKKLWNKELGLVRHTEGQEIYLFADQVSFLEALLAVSELRHDEETLAIGRSLIAAADAYFASPDGGYSDILKEEDAIGELAAPRRPLVANSKWASAISLFGAADHNPRLTEDARRIVLSFNRHEVEAHGLFAAPFISTWWLLERGPTLVEVYDPGTTDPLECTLWLEAKRTTIPAAVVTFHGESERMGVSSGTPFARICTDSGCSGEFTDPAALVRKLKHGAG